MPHTDQISPLPLPAHSHVAENGWNNKQLTWQDRVRIAQETASALACLHSSNIIHRDLKADNVCLAEVRWPSELRAVHVASLATRAVPLWLMMASVACSCPHYIAPSNRFVPDDCYISTLLFHPPRSLRG